MTATAQLERVTFKMSRLAEFFTEKELNMQIGHPSPMWALALTKELVDNALDACETAGVLPEIVVTVEDDGVSVLDNGPGLPAATLERSLDYLVRVSDKSYYVSPTRGQLGNALKCVWAAPYVISGERGVVDVTALGQVHHVEVTFDRIAQRPDLRHTVSPDGLVKTGTLVKMHWPRIASYLSRTSPGDSYSAEIMLKNYAAFNPHATFTWREGEYTWTVERTNAEWAKWKPKDPTSPHWYAPERLRSLIGAYVSEERDGSRPRTVREFVSEFKGLSATAKQKSVTEQAGLSGLYLHDLVDGDDVPIGKVKALLAAMKEESRPVKPDALGVLGEAHLTEHMVSHLCVARDSVKYKKVVAIVRGLPFVLEVAFGIYREKYSGCGRTVLVGLNWTPTIKPPINELLQLLGQARVDRGDPVAIVVHLACPLMEYTDRGKSVLALLKGE